MQEHAVIRIETVIDYIESHMNDKLDLERISQAVHYSKYHLHRMFMHTVGMTISDYVRRRQLTEAAKLLVFSDRPVIEVAFLFGYESQRAFTSAFKAMYKAPPARYRENRVFYPLQHRFALHRGIAGRAFDQRDIRLAVKADIPAWMELMRLSIDGYPAMNEADYLREITKCMEEKRALVLRDGDLLIGAVAFSAQSGSIDFLGIHPQYRSRGIQKLFLDALMETYLPGQEISMTTFREDDKADTGHRALLKQLGFAERELLVEFGYPTQRFAIAPREREDAQA
ncbi:MAG: helix-turn-helix domain-containing protein [Clostridia bacterium]|nr:helix-turn-helix domain-containing protein [Clostridia bacterium]